jgi:hypothetical protein
MPYGRILVFGKCRINVSPYRYRRIRIPYRCNIVQECIKEGRVKVDSIGTTEQVVSILLIKGIGA